MADAELIARLDAKIDGFIKGFSSAEARIVEMEKKLKTATDAADRSAKGFQGLHNVVDQLPGSFGAAATGALRLTTLLAGPAGIAVGATAAAAGLGALALKAGATIERLDNLSATTGLSVAALQALEQAAKEAGEAPESLAQGFRQINAAIADVMQGSTETQQRFKAIGVDLRGMVAAGASAEEVIDAVAKALQRIDDPTRRAAEQQDKLGSRSRAMSIALAQIAEIGLPAYIEKMRQAGVVTSDSANTMARSIDALTDTWTRSWTGMGNTIKEHVLVHVVTLIAQIQELQRLIGKFSGPNAMEQYFATIRRESERAASQGPLFTGGPKPRDMEPLKGAVEKQLKDIDTALDTLKLRSDLGLESFESFVAGVNALSDKLAAVTPRTEAVTKAMFNLQKVMREFVKNNLPAGSTPSGDHPGAELGLPDFRKIAGEIHQIETGLMKEGLLGRGLFGEGVSRDQAIQQLDVIIEGFGLVTTGLEDSLARTHAWHEEINRAGAIRQQWATDIKSLVDRLEDAVQVGGELADTGLRIGNAFGKIPRFDMQSGAGFRLLEPRDQFGRDIETIPGPRLGEQIDERAFADFMAGRQALGKLGTAPLSPAVMALRLVIEDMARGIAQGTLDIEDAIETFVEAFSARVVQQGLDAIFEPANKVGEGLGKLATAIFTDGQTLGQAFSELGANTKQAIAQIATALGVVGGTLLGGAIGGSQGKRQNASLGANIGAGIGSAIPVFGPLGGLVGGLAGGAIGGLFGSDDKKFEKEFRAIGRALRDTTREAVSDGLREAVASSDVESGWDRLKGGLKQAILDATIEALILSAGIREVIDKFAKQFAEVLQGGVRDGLTPQELGKILETLVAGFKDELTTLAPIFKAIFDAATGISKVFDDTLGTVEVQQKVSEDQLKTRADTWALERGMQGTLDAQTEAMLAQLGASEGLLANLKAAGEVEIGVGAPAGEHAGGGMIHGPGGTDRVPAWLTAGEYVVNATATRRHRGLLEAINANRFQFGGLVGDAYAALPMVPHEDPEEWTPEEIRRVAEEFRDTMRETFSIFRDLERVIGGLAAESRDWGRAITMLQRDLATNQQVIDRIRVSAITTTDPEQLQRFARELQEAIEERYAREIELIETIQDRIATLDQAIGGGLGALTNLVRLRGGTNLLSAFTGPAPAGAGTHTSLGGLSTAGAIGLFGAQASLAGPGQIGSVLAGLPPLLAEIGALTDPNARIGLLTQLEATIETLFASVEQAADAWRGVARSIREQVLGILTGNLGPTNPSERFATAQTAFTNAKAAFFANPTAEGAAEVQALASTMLEVASEFTTRPSSDYQTLMRSVVEVLNRVEAIAGAQVAGIDPLQDLATQFGTDLGNLETALVGAITDALGEQSSAQGALNEITHGLGPEGHLAKLQADQLRELTNLHRDFVAVAAYFGIPVGSFAGGTEYVPRTGLAMVHRGEAIIPAAQNTRGGGGASVVIGDVYVTSAASDPRAVAKEVMAEITRSARTGALHRVIQETRR